MKRILILFLISITIQSCEKDIDAGIIVEQMHFGTCIPVNLPAEEYTITTDSSYQLLLGNSVCQNFSLPPIDFNQYSLLGKFTRGQCRVTFKPQVVVSATSMQYVFTIYIFEKGSCKKEAQDMNWVLVPKLPPGYSVLFEIKEG
jgi:hypothetical protein